jgi:hypothetical protein
MIRASSVNSASATRPEALGSSARHRDRVISSSFFAPVRPVGVDVAWIKN